MKHKEPKPGIVIDVAPDQGNGTPEEGPTSGGIGRGPEKAGSDKARWPAVLALLVILGMVFAGFLGYRHWSDLAHRVTVLDAQAREQQAQQQQLRASIDRAAEAVLLQESTLGEQRDVLAQQHRALDEARAAFRQQEQTLVEEGVRLQEREAELRAAVAEVHNRVGTSGTQWMIAEAEYLLRIANHRLTLARDTGTARVALDLADQRLRDNGDPGWAGVREQIARDAAKLDAFEAPDIAGLASGLSAMIEQIPELQLAQAFIEPRPAAAAQAPPLTAERNWETLLEDLWSGFKDTVRIRQHDAPLQAMLAPEHEFFLYENLKLHLEAARLGLARGDQALFRSNLQLAADWLDRYFDPKDARRAALAGAIDELRAIEIRPALPDISLSLRALQARRKLGQDITPGGTGPQ